MSFTTPCFIRRNSPELREKLDNLGYLKSFTDGNLLHCDHEDYCAFDYESSLIEKDFMKGSIDCGENEQLFLSLAALRDDSDYRQYFYNKHNKYRWLLCNQNDVTNEVGVTDDWIKATPQELIEHFNKQGL